MTLHIRLLGAFSVTEDGAECYALHGTRTEAFLAWLLLHPHNPQPRRQMAFAFWPDSSERQSLGNLRKVLHEVRHALPGIETYLHINTRTLHWKSDSPFVLDVTTFEDLLTQAGAASHDPVAEHGLLEEAIALYRGDLLPNCFDDWIALERDRLRHAFLGALQRLIDLSETLQEYPAAIAHANHLLRHEPTQETTYRRLMQLYLLLGDKAAALNVYYTCATLLQRELEVSPNLEMQAEYARLLEMDGLERETPNGAAARQPLRSRAGTVTRLVGREDEWLALRSAWNRATDGGVHLCLIRGEAGIGKSRLAHSFLHWAREQGFAVAQSRAYQMQGQLAYTSVIDWLAAPPLQAALDKVEDVWLTELTRLLPELLVERPDLPHPEALRDGRQRQRIFAALNRSVFAAQQPLVLFLDDAQWCDRESLEWLHYLLGKGDGYNAPHSRTQVFILCTARSEDLDESHSLFLLLAALDSAGRLAEIDLAPLSAEQTEEMAAQLNRNSISSQVARALFAYTEGNPLYIVETLADDGWEAYLDTPHSLGNPQPANGQNGILPAKIYATIRERLAHLNREARQLASLAAVIGRGFDFETLRLAGQMAEEAAMRSLDELWRRGIVTEESGGTYDFSHDRIRDVAYAEIGPVQLPLLHRRVAQVLEARHTGDPDSISGQIARHYEAAGDRERAIAAYQQIAQAARKVHALAEAISYYRRALDLLVADPPSHRRDEHELLLQTELGACLVAVEGNVSADVQRVYTQAMHLCERLGRPVDAPILRALASVHIIAGSLRMATELGERLLRTAEQNSDDLLLVESHHVLGLAAFYQGYFGLARRHLEEAIARYNPDWHADYIILYAQDPQVICLSELARVLWYLGYPDQARHRMAESLALARQLGHPYSLSYALADASLLLLEIGDWARAEDMIDQLLHQRERYGITGWHQLGEKMQGWLQVQLGVLEAGLTQMQQILENRDRFIRHSFAVLPEETRGESGAYTVIWLAEAYLRQGNPVHGLDVLADAAARMERTGEGFCAVEWQRVQGELLLAQETDSLEVEACFDRALTIAHQQQAPSLELKAAISLAQFWQGQGRLVEAHSLLAEIYNWFTEGFDTPDLQAAKSLLDSLVP